MMVLRVAEWTQILIPPPTIPASKGSSGKRSRCELICRVIIAMNASTLESSFEGYASLYRRFNLFVQASLVALIVVVAWDLT